MTACALLSFIRASILCIQNDDVPVGPTTKGGLAVVLRLSGIKTGWFVGNMRIAATRARLIKKGDHLPSFPFQPALIHHHPSVFQSRAAWVFFSRASTLGGGASHFAWFGCDPQTIWYQGWNGLLEARAFLCAGDVFQAIYSSSLSRDHTSLQSGVVGSATGGSRLLLCLAKATARALHGGSAEL